MKDYAKLKQTLNDADASMQKTIGHLGTMAKDAERVSVVARDAHFIIQDIDKQFAEKTKLNKTDITFLFLATALQCARQYLLPNNAFKITADEGDTLIKDPLKKVVKKKDWQEILLGSVPYDAVAQTADFKDMDIQTGISGNTHRYRTLGHDPVLGWIFGPVNILSDSLTKHNFVETYSVEHMKISGFYPGSTIGAVNGAIGIIQSDSVLLAAAVTKQAMHFGADYFTKQGLPIPILSSINNDFSKFMINCGISTYSITRSATLALIINALIGIIHALFYNAEKDGNIKLYEVRTRKILSYSNTIASASNVIAVAIGSAIGIATDNPALVKKSISYLDVGGLIITLHRIISDYNFIKQIKLEFFEKEFYNIVMGDDFDF